MTEANRLTHYRLLMTAFLWVNTMAYALSVAGIMLLITAFLWVNNWVVIKHFHSH